MIRDASASIGGVRYRTEITIGPHGLVVDEPGGLGGGDEGPSPTALLLASIASCKVITAKMYAERKGWPVERIDARASATEAAGHRIVRVEVELSVVGELSDEQRRRVLEIAEKCPVQQAVGQGIVVASRLAGGARP